MYDLWRGFVSQFLSFIPAFILYLSACLLSLAWFNLIHWPLPTQWFKKQKISHIAEVLYHSDNNNGNADSGRDIRVKRVEK